MQSLRINRPIRNYLILMAALIVVSGILFWVTEDQLEATKVQTDSVTPAYSDGGLSGTNVLQQPFQVTTDTLDQILLYIGTYGRENQGSFTLQILDGEEVVWQHGYMTNDLKDLNYNAFMLDDPLEDVKEKEFVLQILTFDIPQDQTITFYFGNTMSASKVEVPVDVDAPLKINGEAVEGMLCMSLVGRNILMVKQLYWPAIVLIALLLTGLFWFSYIQQKKYEKGLFVKIQGIKRYSFLLKQLVMRDFKTKYKRSVLGVLWSFLNPLLTMSVQYLIFAALFESSIENFAVYLMTGVVIFNFFSESVGLGLTSIVANAPLITKVYVPKYIYPVSRVLSSAVNVLISMIPLSIMILLSGLPLTKALLLVPLVLAFITIFCIGMSLLLSSLMVFFRDTQFLWGILSMLWMYMTPIFYPESIIPHEFLPLYHMNPLYQFIFFLREITLNGVSPGPDTFLYCALASLIPLLIGLLVFKKVQDRFVFYL